MLQLVVRFVIHVFTCTLYCRSRGLLYILVLAFFENSSSFCMPSHLSILFTSAVIPLSYIIFLSAPNELRDSSKKYAIAFISTPFSGYLL
jgi:hypothetical protein